MKAKIVLSFFLVLCSLSIFAQNDTTKAVVQETEWVAIKESSVDSLTLTYLKQKGLVTYVTPKDENNSIFVSVMSYLTKLFDSSLSSISKNTNKFYDTPIGFWVVWGTFYHYVGNEILGYIFVVIYLLTITLLFLWLWKKHCIHKRLLVDPMLSEEKKGKNDDILEYEVKGSNIKLQFWLLLVYIVLFLIGGIIL